jgi:hypothetical protein
VRAVNIPGGNHLDRRRTLTPRDYLADPWAFGSHHTTPATPAGGDKFSARVAWLQHHLVLAWRQAGQRPSGAALGRRFGFSRQVWSRSATGHRWMGETVMAAVLDALWPPPPGAERRRAGDDGAARRDASRG